MEPWPWPLFSERPQPGLQWGRRTRGAVGHPRREEGFPPGNVGIRPGDRERPVRAVAEPRPFEISSESIVQLSSERTSHASHFTGLSRHRNTTPKTLSTARATRYSLMVV